MLVDQLERVHLFYGAALTLLLVRRMRASAIGRVVYHDDLYATARARGGLLAMRQLGWVDANVEDDAAYWRITKEGRAWFREKITGHLHEDAARRA